MAKKDNTIWIIAGFILIVIGIIFFNSSHTKNLINDTKDLTYCNEGEGICTKELCENTGGQWRQTRTEFGPSSFLCSCTGVDNSKPNCFWISNQGCDCKMEAH